MNVQNNFAYLESIFNVQTKCPTTIWSFGNLKNHSRCLCCLVKQNSTDQIKQRLIYVAIRGCKTWSLHMQQKTELYEDSPWMTVLRMAKCESMVFQKKNLSNFVSLHRIFFRKCKQTLRRWQVWKLPRYLENKKSDLNQKITAIICFNYPQLLAQSANHFDCRRNEKGKKLSHNLVY